MRRTALLATALTCLPAAGQGHTVSLSGTLGAKALLIIDGSPRTVEAGQTVAGVKLLSVSGNDAVVEVDGHRQTLSLGGAQVNLGTDSNGGLIVLKAGSGGHFIAAGTINGRAVNFLVDTGATYVALGAAQAQSLGIDFLHGQRGTGHTANGPVVMYRVALTSVQLGEVMVYNVEAVVLPQPMDQVLLGNSFLSHFEMKRNNDTMTLTKRY
jgi:aspartyl protease family protein